MQHDSEDTLHLVITGGGTGGHVYPGIAVAREVRRQVASAAIAFFGTQTGLEAKIVPAEGFVLETIHIQGFRGRGIPAKLKTLSTIPRAVYRSRRLLKMWRPDVVFGTGGYVSVPVIYAAYLLHIPTLILEPNRQPGLANKLLSKAVDKIAICFQETAQAFPPNKVVFTGNPIRKAFTLIGKTPPPDPTSKFNLLIIGGSRGAQRINTAMMEALHSLSAYRERLHVTHQTGKSDYAQVNARYESLHVQADVRAYIEDMPQMYAKAHLIICRAGAGTVAELTASRRPAILIPYPHGDRHQEYNARALEEAGRAQVILQQDLRGKSLADAILHHLHHPELLERLWTDADATSDTDPRTAAEQIVDICRQLARNRTQ
ncbi:undecaprenyldiphospho-muramoylpentapeptide beta-N-acetylglucosaminyltransferase [candidate division KSB3 bacterium]|uniref:UDP-N-acetylglucosamine--N-acetylmuramyl-(pentapeptide) pyrophosphoryl-undecaprenol N-acetylglucosamine transferase n=1 Tax=candidate division KSB3 bacterium TaxID=2044937 RepID=A0A9D5JYU1_9BACT|nr:undecaprenyldiphospho-muramoylpentapeptide beta-N-acetylglucosaminyltransferase [candidate division KSB3 bacterium]MBD3326723.1 undecaprenyldiphospho-muramoylpentapeptide beta-N-acetylglucosaminyltransferase [candidate division KSB3 bacterium]